MQLTATQESRVKDHLETLSKGKWAIPFSCALIICGELTQKNAWAILELVCHGRLDETFDPTDEHTQRRSQLTVHGQVVLVNVQPLRFEPDRYRVDFNVFYAPPHNPEPMGCFLIYDVMDRTSFEQAVQSHGLMLDTIAQSRLPKNENGGARRLRVPFMILADQADKPEDIWIVTREEGEQFSDRIGADFRVVSTAQQSGYSKDMLQKMVEAGISHKLERQDESDVA